MIPEKPKKLQGGGTTSSSRIGYIDALKGFVIPLRILATLAVIYLHTNSTLGDHADIFALDYVTASFYSHIASMMCWAVPCFFMITGTLLLQKERQITVQSCFYKYVRRILLALFLFGVPFALIKTFFETKTLLFHSLLDALLAVLQNKSWDHLWYLYTLVGAYLLLPMLKRFTDNCTKNELQYACLLLLFFDCLVPVINAACGIEIAFTIWLPLRPCFYILAGHYLSEYPLKIKPWLSFICAIILLAGIWVLDGCGSAYLYVAIKTFLVVLVSIAVFATFQTMQIDISKRTKTMLWRIDRLCFGVYLIHPVFIHAVYQFFHISPANFGNSIIVVSLFFLGFSAVSFAASWIMSLIKPLRKYVL